MDETSRTIPEQTEAMTYRLCLGRFLKANGVTIYRLIQEVEGQIPRSTVYDMARKPQIFISVAHLLALSDALTRLLDRKVKTDDLIFYLPVSESAA